MYSCRVTSAAGGGFSTSSATKFINCLFYDFAASQIVLAGCTSGTAFINCTFDNVAGKCITIPDSAQTAIGLTLINVHVTNCATFCENLRTASQVFQMYSINNRIRDVTNPYVGWYDNANASLLDVTTDQDDATEYAGVANNDYHLNVASSGKGAGYPPYLDTGCWQRQEPVDRPEMAIYGGG